MMFRQTRSEIIFQRAWCFSETIVYSGFVYFETVMVLITIATIEIQLTQIPDSIDLSFLGNNTLFEEETSIQGVGISCLSANKKEKTFISFNDTEAGWYCDRTWHCQFGGVFYFIKVLVNNPSPFLSLSSSSPSFFIMVTTGICHVNNHQQLLWTPPSLSLKWIFFTF